MTNQRHETPSDESENDINPKIESGLKWKRRKGVRFQARRRCCIGAPKHITTHINGCPKDKYIAVNNKGESETDLTFSCQPPKKYM